MNAEVLDILKEKSPAEALRRIDQAIAETQRLIDKESRYSPEFRNIKLLVDYAGHLEKLQLYRAEIAG